jgi:hypothetical protein
LQTAIEDYPVLPVPKDITEDVSASTTSASVSTQYPNVEYRGTAFSVQQSQDRHHATQSEPFDHGGDEYFTAPALARYVGCCNTTVRGGH